MFSFAIAALVLGMVNALDWNAIIRRCLARADYTFKGACADMGIDEGQFSHQLQGEGHLSLKRLDRLSAEFWRHFAVEVAKRVGLPEEYHVARRLEEAAAIHSEERWSA